MAKEFTWQGRSEEQIKKMEFKEFIELAPAPLRRSLKRGFTDAQKKLLKRVQREDKNIETHCRDMVILPSMIGMTIKVFNGKEFLPVGVAPDMLGHRLGEFSHTRKPITHSGAGIGATRSSKGVSAR